MFEKEAEEYATENWEYYEEGKNDSKELKQAYQQGAEFGYNKANEWHNLNKNCKDLPNEGEQVEGLYIWYYKGEPCWDVFRVCWYYEIGELDEKLVRWYGYNKYNTYDRDYWNKVAEPDYWRKITLPMRNEYDRNY